MSKKKKIIIAVIAVVVLGIISLIVFKGKGELPYDFVIVERSDVIEEVSATGTVKSAEDVNLRFETSGTVENVYVSEGSEVKQGAHLVKLYTGKLYSQFLQAQASYNQAKAELDKLLAGSTTEEVKVAEQVVENARIALEDVKTKADNDLAEKYDDALVYLSNVSSKANITLADLRNLEPKYFSGSGALASTFSNKEAVARDAFFGISRINREGAKEIADKAISNPTNENIDNALTEMRTAIDKIKDALDYAREAMSDPTLREDVAVADQTTVDTDITNMNTALTNISTAQQAVASQKITNQTNINSAENTLNKAEDDLAKIEATPRDVDIAVYQAKVDQNRASMVELQQKLNDAVLKAPINGIVSKVNVKIGETVIAGGETAVSLISPIKFQIEVDIPESDIGKVDLNNPTEISLDAFPEESWPGQVAEMEPAETLIEGVVYYRVTVIFDEIDERVRSGMSADVTIETNRRENVLSVPYRAVVYKEGKKIVRVLEGKEMREIEVEAGLKGSNGEIEIVSGVNEGDKVVTFIKSR